MSRTVTLHTKQGRRLPCFFHDSLPSTNDEAKRLAREGGRGRFSVAAAEQTAGRGRMSREFFSPRENGLYLSFVTPARGDFAKFGALSALAVGELLQEFFGIDVSFKWPNDVVAEGRKMCGILPESIVDAEGRRLVVVGVGINVFEAEEDFGALSQIAVSARQCCANADLMTTFLRDKRAVLHDMAVRLTELLSRLADVLAAGEDLIPAYRGKLVTLGERVSFKGEDGSFRTGVAADVAEDCALLVDTAEGRVRVGWGEVVRREDGQD